MMSRMRQFKCTFRGNPTKNDCRSEPWWDYECDCGRKLVGVKAYQIKQHRDSPTCREAHLHILSQNFLAERVEAVPSDFAFEQESNTIGCS